MEGVAIESLAAISTGEENNFTYLVLMYNKCETQSNVMNSCLAFLVSFSYIGTRSIYFRLSANLSLPPRNKMILFGASFSTNQLPVRVLCYTYIKTLLPSFSFFEMEHSPASALIDAHNCLIYCKV
jgi:hypothetical protein